MDRSYLFAPGHSAKLLDRVFTAGADALMLDLEDAVPPQHKAEARRMVAAALADPPAPARAWVRVNAARTDMCAADLDAVAGHAYGIRIPKTESPDDVAWVAARAPGLPIICAIENARGVLAAQEIAAVPGVRHLAMGGGDLQRDLNTSGGNAQPASVRSPLVVCSRAAGIEPPIDSVFPRLSDDAELRSQAEFARSLGFSGKSAIHPRQLPVLHEVFTPSERGGAWAQEAREVLGAAGRVWRGVPGGAGGGWGCYPPGGGAALRLPGGASAALPGAAGAGGVLKRADAVPGVPAGVGRPAPFVWPTPPPQRLRGS